MSDVIVLMATAWGAKHGGINSFNRDLAVALANVIQHPWRIVCVVPTATEDERYDAKVNDVELIVLDPSDSPEHLPEHRVHEVRTKLKEARSAWWLCHDVVTGPIGLKARELYGGRCAVIHHMNYEAYLPYHQDAPSEKIKLQRHVLLAADQVFAVGPKLAESAREKLRGKQGANVSELIPGLAVVEGLDHSARFSAITFGRVDPANDRVKQARLAVAAFGRARAISSDSLGADASLTVLGLSAEAQDDERRDLQTLLDSQAGRAVPLHGWPFSEDRATVLDHLRQYSVCLMLSVHEGFGLAGWEAIASEVPLILSTNTGVYDTIEQHLGGVGRGCIRPVNILGAAVGASYREEDVESVARALLDVRMHGVAAKRDAKVLKGLLGLACTWEHTALAVTQACKVPVSHDMPRDSLAQWTPDLLIEAFKKGSDVVKEATRRGEHFSNVWRRLMDPAEISRRLVLFGGVSQSVCSAEAATKLGNWLAANREAQLFLCYETGEAAAARAQRLDEDRLETKSGLSAKALKRMVQKQNLVEALPELIGRQAGIDAEVLQRIHLVEITKPLSTYVVITDSEVFLTPLFERRASETLSFSLSGKSSTHEVIKSLLYHIENVERPNVTTAKLATELRTAFGIDQRDPQNSLRDK